MITGAAASRLRGAGSPCGKGLGGALEKGLWAYNTAQRFSMIGEKLQSGGVVGAVLDTVEAAVGVRRVHEVVHPPADWRSLLREFLSANARNDYS